MILVQDIRQAAKQYRSIVAVLGCGGGKSIIQAEIARNATDKGHRVLSPPKGTMQADRTDLHNVGR